MNIPAESRDQLAQYFEDLRAEYQQLLACDDIELKPLLDLLNEETFMAGAKVLMFSIAHPFTENSLLALKVTFDRGGSLDDFCNLLRVFEGGGPKEMQ
jgi:hypothetical protein